MFKVPNVLCFFNILFLFLCAIATAAASKNNDKLTSYWTQSPNDGLSEGNGAALGLTRISKPYINTPYVSAGWSTGYGVFESIGNIDGAHHRLVNRLALSAAFPSWLSYGLQLNSHLDSHPYTNNERDASFVLDPEFWLRSGFILKNKLELGGEFKLWIPGTDEHALAWQAFALTSKLLMSYAKADSPWRFNSLIGFRLDNSSKAIQNELQLRQGDWISAGLSDFNALLLGVTANYTRRPFRVFSEVSSAILIGENAPPVWQSNFRVGLGGQYAFNKRVSLSILFETLISKRPKLEQQHFIPLEPRFVGLIGIIYQLGFYKKTTILKSPSNIIKELNIPIKKKKAERPPKKTPPAEPAPLVATTLIGYLLDDQKRPIADATVTIQREHWTENSTEASSEQDSKPTMVDNTETTYSNDNGVFQFEQMPEGTAKLIVVADGFGKTSLSIKIDSASPHLDAIVLTPIKTGSRIQGQVRSFKGKPLIAWVKLTALNLKVKTDNQGFFVLDVPKGNYQIEISTRGYKKQTIDTAVGENSVNIINVEMTQKK